MPPTVTKWLNIVLHQGRVVSDLHNSKTIADAQIEGSHPDAVWLIKVQPVEVQET